MALADGEDVAVSRRSLPFSPLRGQDLTSAAESEVAEHGHRQRERGDQDGNGCHKGPHVHSRAKCDEGACLRAATELIDEARTEVGNVYDGEAMALSARRQHLLGSVTAPPPRLLERVGLIAAPDMCVDLIVEPLRRRRLWL